jgi:hypothetical protein
MNPLIGLKRTAPPFLITLTLLCFGLLPKAQAVVPPPDGGYPGFNTAEGQNALFSLTAGSANTAVGWYSLFSNIEGDFNTATGAGALLFNTAIQNTAFGATAVLFNTTGFNNTAVGAAALLNNINGTRNNALGFEALNSHTTGSFNNAFGGFALFFDQNGEFNNAFGDDALTSNVSGINNTAMGDSALVSSTGSNNTALGADAGSSLTTGDNNIDIGNTGVAGESATTRIGSEFQTRTFISAIRGVTTGIADAVNVVIDSNGQLGTMSSSRRYKKEIKPMDQTSEAILALKPVMFHYKSDKANTPQFGLIAEEVAEVNPDLVVRDDNGEIYTVRYEAVNAMLLNEFLKEHRKNEEQQATIAQLKKDLQTNAAQHQKQIEALTAGLQKVSAQLEATKPAPQVVKNNQ